MDRDKWEKTITQFQACIRGYLVRKEVRSAQEDFEKIVKEIDGGLTQLKWTGTVISFPHFTDAGGPYVLSCTSASKPSDAGACVSARSQSPAPLPEERDHCVLLEKTEAERDEAHVCLPSSSEEQGQRTVENKDGEVMESLERSSIWSSLELDMNYDPSYKGPPQQHCLAQEVPRTPEALRLHRNTLTMELVWLQQAIDSRKKYLSLKDRLSVS
ncbi:IQ domain-containing protein C [Parambassis ranga]|uniref:IQ domain-containing protein C n=1 Tax=Parambassis ranga TaxID=210632 RepID=A0A6P7HD38_9TELE|nr:IQ domain-containing protein C [Parambassis ranga]